MKDNPKKVKLFMNGSNSTAAKSSRRYEKVTKAPNLRSDTYESYLVKKRQLERKYLRIREKIFLEFRSLLIEKKRLLIEKNLVSLALEFFKEDVKSNNSNSQEEE